MELKSVIRYSYIGQPDKIKINSTLDQREVLHRIRGAYKTNQLMVDLTGTNFDWWVRLINLGQIREIDVMPYKGDDNE